MKSTIFHFGAVGTLDSHEDFHLEPDGHPFINGCFNGMMNRIFNNLYLEEMVGNDHNFHLFLGGGFKHFIFSPLPGEIMQFDYIIFFKWVEPTN